MLLTTMLSARVNLAHINISDCLRNVFLAAFENSRIYSRMFYNTFEVVILRSHTDTVMLMGSKMKGKASPAILFPQQSKPISLFHLS